MAMVIVTVCLPLASGLSAVAVTLTTSLEFLPWARAVAGDAARAAAASSAIPVRIIGGSSSTSGVVLAATSLISTDGAVPPRAKMGRPPHPYPSPPFVGERGRGEGAARL